MENSNLSHETNTQRAFIVQVYMWMTLALLTTAVVALCTANSESFYEILFENHSFFYILLIAEVLLVSVLSGMIKKMSPAVAFFIFFAYAALNGLTFSSIFILYDLGSIANIFFITAGTFAFMCIYGYFTKTDLSGIGNICFMGLIGIIIAAIANIFMHNSFFDLIICIVGVIIFVGLTAYDTQKIKQMSVSMNYNQDVQARTKGSILGALELYLDFINLFYYLLRLFGKRR